MIYSAEHGPESGRPQDFNDLNAALKSRRPERATLIVRGEAVSVTWEELDTISRLAHNDPPAALTLGDQWRDRERDERRP